MTLTETRPPEAATPAVAPPVEHGALALVTTGDHKRLGLNFALLGLVALLAAAAAAFLFQVGGDSADAFLQAESRLASAATIAAFVIGIPALWLGLATYVVPLQIGGHRLALPRLHNLALWLFAGGSLLCVIAFLADDVRLTSLAASVPATAAPNQPAPDAVLLLVAAVALVALGTLLAAAGLLVTILNRRAEGFRLLHVPAFTWSALSTSLVLVLTTPVFLAGLILLYLDQRYGGTFFVDRGGLRVWTHELWLLGRPESLLFFAAGIGIYCDIAATALRRPLAFFPIARAGAAAAPLAALAAWAGDVSILGSPFAPFGNVVALVALVAPGLCVLTWLASARGARPQLTAGVLPLAAHFAVDALLVAAVIGAIVAGLDDAESQLFRNGQVVLLVLTMPVLALAAGCLHWMPKLRARVANPAQGALTTLLLLGGAALFAAPSYIGGFGAEDPPAVVGAVGAAVFAAGLLSLLPAVAGPTGSAPRDPYEGLTLEWSAASPPVRHNFDEIPDIRSPYPLYDARVESNPSEGGS